MEHEVGYNSDGVVNTSATDAPKKRGFLGENRNLWLVLGGLIVIAIVLVVGIVMVTLSGKGGTNKQIKDDGYDRASVESDCTDRDEYNGIMLCIENDYYLGNEDLDKALSRYDKNINDKITKEEWDLAARLISAEAMFNYIETEDCDSALKYYDKYDLGQFSDSSKAFLYSEAGEMAYECSDSKYMDKYSVLYNDVMEQINDEGDDIENEE